MLPRSRRMLLAGERQGQPWTDSHLSWWMQVHLISIRPVYFIYPVNLNHEKNFELKLRIKLKTSESFRPQLLRWQMSCPAHNVLGFERGVKEAIYIRPKGPTLKRDGGRYNFPSAPVCGQNREGGWARAYQQWRNRSTLWARHNTCQRLSEQDFSWKLLSVFNSIWVLS